MALNRNSVYNANDTSWMDAGVEPSERGAVSKALRFMFGVGKGVVKGTVAGAWDKVKEDNLANLEKVEDTLADAQQAANKSIKELSEGFGELKSAAKSVALKYTEGSQAFLPQGLYRRLSRAFEEEQTYEESPEERFESSLSSNLSSIFAAQSRSTAALHRVSMQSAATDRALRARYHGQSMQVATATSRAAINIDNFLNTTYLSYLKKDLELKYRSLHTANIIKEHINTVAEAFGKDGLMGELLKAASMSDHEKASAEAEVAQSKRRVNTTQSYMKDFFKTMMESATAMPSMIMTALSMGLGMEGSTPIASTEEMVQRIAQFASPMSLNFLKKHLLSKKNQRKVDRWLNTAKGHLGTLNEDLGYLMGNKSMLANSLGSYLRGKEGWLPRWIGSLMPEYERTTHAENKASENPTAPAVFDNLTRESIIAVIPAHLERIGNQLEAFVHSQGIKPSPDQDKVYDVRSRSLVTRSERRKRNIENIYGNSADRAERAKSNVTIFLDMLQGIDDVRLQAEAQAEVTDFKEQIHMFIMRSARVNRAMNVQAIMKVAKGDFDGLNMEEADYIKATFGKVNSVDTTNTARVLLKACSTRNAAGRSTGINHNYVRMVNNQIRKMAKELDESDETRKHIEDLNYFDEEDYRYDVEGNTSFRERSRTEQFARDFDRIYAAEQSDNESAKEEAAFVSYGENEAAERATKKFRKDLTGKDQQTKLRASMAAMATGMNSFAFLPSWMINTPADAYNWTLDELKEMGIDQSLTQSTFLKDKLEKLTAGNKLKIFKIIPLQEDENDKKKYKFEVRYIDTTGIRRSKHYTLPFSSVDVSSMDMANAKTPNGKLLDLVRTVIDKLGGAAKVEAAYSETFWSPNEELDEQEEEDWYEKQQKASNTKISSGTIGGNAAAIKATKHSITDFLESLDENVTALRNKIVGGTPVLSLIGKSRFAASLEALSSQFPGPEPAPTPTTPEAEKRYSRVGKRELIATTEAEWDNTPMSKEEQDAFRKKMARRIKQDPMGQIVLDAFDSAVQSGNWAKARELSKTQTNLLVDDKKGQDATTAKKIEQRYNRVSFDASVEGADQIQVRFESDMRLLRRLGSSATVRKHLADLSEALAEKNVKTRTKKMIDALDAIESSKTLFVARHGHSDEWYQKLNANMELNMYNPSYIPKEEEGEFLNEADSDRAYTLRERVTKYIEMGVDLTQAQEILDKMQSSAGSGKEATQIMDQVDAMLEKADKATEDLRRKYEDAKKAVQDHPRTKSLKEAFDRSKTDIKEAINAIVEGDMDKLKKGKLAQTLMEKIQQAKEEAAKQVGKVTRRFGRGTNYKNKADYDAGITESSDEAYGDLSDIEEDEGEGFFSNVWNGIKGLFGGSSSYADGSARGMATLFSRKNKEKKKQRDARQMRKIQNQLSFGKTGYQSIDITPIAPFVPVGPKTDDQVLLDNLKNNRITNVISGLLSGNAKITKVDDSIKTMRTAMKAGVSAETAAVLGFLSSIARKMDRSLLDAGDRAASEMAQRYGEDDDSFWQWMPKKYQRKLKAYKRLYKSKATKWMKAARKRSRALARLYKGKLLKAAAPYLARGKELLIAGKEGLMQGLSATGGAIKNFGIAAVPRLKAVGSIAGNAITKYMPAFSTAGGALASLGLGALGGGMGALGSASSGAGALSQAFSGITGGAAGLLALSNPVTAGILAAAMGANALREGWNDKKSLEKSWGTGLTANDYQKGSTALGNIANYLTFGLLNKTGGRKYVDRFNQYGPLAHIVGGVGGQIAGTGQMLKSITGGENSPMTELELKRARAKLSIDIKRGAPDGQQRLEDFENAVAEKNWYRARGISGIHFEAGKMFAQGLKRAAKGTLAIATLGFSSMAEMAYDKLIGNQDKPMTEDEIKRAYKNFAIREKKDPAIKELRLNFEEAVAGERWAVARKLAHVEDMGLLAKKFGKGWGTAAGAFMASPVGLGIMLFANNENEPMTEKEIQTFEEKCQNLIKNGNTRAQDLLDKFEDAVANGKWALARKLSNKQTESLFMKGAQMAYNSFRWFNPIGWFFTDQSRPMSETDIVNFRKKMEYMISKGDQLAKQKLEKFEIAVMNEDWKTARKIAQMPHKSIANRVWNSTVSAVRWMFYADQDKPLTSEEIDKFRKSMMRKIELGEPGADKILEKFDDAVGMQKWRLAREISNMKNTSVLRDIGNWFKSGWNAVDRFFSGGDDAAMSQDEIDKYRARMQKLIAMGNMQAKQALDRFNDAVLDNDWKKARKISGLKYESLGARFNKWVTGTDENLSDDKLTSDTRVAQRYRLLFDRVKEAMQKPSLAQVRPMLAQLRNDMQSTDLLALDDEMMDEWENRLRRYDSSVGMATDEDITNYDQERKAKLKLVEQRDALLTEIAAAQERCPWREGTRRSELKRLFREVSDLTMDELDQELLDSYDDELRIFDKDALTTKNLSEEERKRQAENYKRKEVLLGSIDQAIDRCGITEFSKSTALRKLKGDVYSTLVEEIDNDLFDAWDQELKDLDAQASSSKQYSAEERKKQRELNNRRITLAGMIKQSINKTGVMFGRGNRTELQKLLQEVESTLDEDLSDELVKDWEEQLKFLDSEAMSIDEKNAYDKEHGQLLRDKRMFRRSIELKSRKLLRSRTSDEVANGKGLQQIVNDLDAISDEAFTREALEKAKQDAAKFISAPPAPKDQTAALSSGANEQAISLDRNGNVVDMQEGSPTKVSLKTVPGGQIIHTHPDGSPTSATDIASAIENGQTAVTTLRSSGTQVLGYSGMSMTPETIKLNKEQAEKSQAEMHSLFSDIKDGIGNGVNAALGNRDVLTGIYERLGDLIDVVGEHNVQVNDRIDTTAMKSYSLSRQFTINKMKQKVKDITPVFRPSTIAISK